MYGCLGGTSLLMSLARPVRHGQQVYSPEGCVVLVVYAVAVTSHTNQYACWFGCKYDVCCWAVTGKMCVLFLLNTSGYGQDCGRRQFWGRENDVILYPMSIIFAENTKYSVVSFLAIRAQQDKHDDSKRDDYLRRCMVAGYPELFGASRAQTARHTCSLGVGLFCATSCRCWPRSSLSATPPGGTSPVFSGASLLRTSESMIQEWFSH